MEMMTEMFGGRGLDRVRVGRRKGGYFDGGRERMEREMRNRSRNDYDGIQEGDVNFGVDCV